VGTEHLGLYVGLATTLDDLGPYGHVLQTALTLHDYLRKGIALYNLLVSGQRLWLAEHGDELRVHIAGVGGSKLGAHQSHIETVIVTIAQCRQAAGAHWSPREIGLAYRSREPLPPIDHFAGSRIVYGTDDTYFTLPRALLGLRYQGGSAGAAQATDAASPAASPLPEDLAGLVQLQIEALLPGRAMQIDTVAETLGMSARSLQRALERQGLTYSKLLGEARVRQAAKWLEGSDKPVAEIAFDLGYTDAANFTRAFRRQTGVPPQTFRANAGRSEAIEAPAACVHGGTPGQ
jgi:AraC-like DNA-binding protein